MSPARIGRFLFALFPKSSAVVFAENLVYFHFQFIFQFNGIALSEKRLAI
ncbi:MAG: hypothetical protein KDA72_19435 [Planctomycetales bacterium]|nr:hypothetical protein [Planctomycetales bacterium]